MIRLWLALALILGSSATNAQTETQTETEAKYTAFLTTCFDRAPPFETDRAACIGKVVAACGFSDDNTEPNACMSFAWVAWEALMLREYEALRAVLADLDTNISNPEMHAGVRLQNAQERWTSFSKEECSFQAVAQRDFGAGIMCLRDMTANRAIALWKTRLTAE